MVAILIQITNDGITSNFELWKDREHESAVDSRRDLDPILDLQETMIEH